MQLFIYLCYLFHMKIVRSTQYRTKNTGLLILQYCIGIASIGYTFSSIARVLQYFLKTGIGIGIANTFIEYWYLIYSNINSQYFSIAQERH